MSFWNDLKNVFFPPKSSELAEHNRQVRSTVHADRNDAMATQAQQMANRRQINEIYKATRMAVRRLQQQQNSPDGQDRRPGNGNDKGNHRPEHPPAVR